MYKQRYVEALLCIRVDIEIHIKASFNSGQDTSMHYCFVMVLPLFYLFRGLHCRTQFCTPHSKGSFPKIVNVQFLQGVFSNLAHYYSSFTERYKCQQRLLTTETIDAIILTMLQAAERTLLKECINQHQESRCFNRQM